MKEQLIINTKEELNEWISDKCTTLLVCDLSINSFAINDFFMQLTEVHPNKIIRYSDFESNPDYESVIKGVEKFKEKKCDSIIAVGGGSAMDVAKCIRLFSSCDKNGDNGEWLNLSESDFQGVDNIPFLAMPTTAGTGSEATRFAVIYYKGVKQSITSNMLIPEIVLMDSRFLTTLPMYQRKSTMLDALCHAIESYWSVNSTEESQEYSKKSIEAIIENMEAYINNKPSGNEAMLMAAHMAGKAINITQTTAGHAMCYKITTLFNIAHGHAAALVNRVLYKWMVTILKSNEVTIVDSRGVQQIEKALTGIAESLGCKTAEEGADKIIQIYNMLGLEIPNATEEQLEILTNSVNPIRLKNHPIALDSMIIKQLYTKIINIK